MFFYLYILAVKINMIFEITIIFPPIKHFKKNYKKFGGYNRLFFNNFQKRNIPPKERLTLKKITR